MTVCIRVVYIMCNLCTHAHVQCIFTCDMTEANAMVLPGRVPGYKSLDVQLFPSSTTKNKVWELYQEATTVSSMRPVDYSTFYQVVERTPAICCCDETDDRPLLGLSAQQHYHQQEFQPLCRR